ncbi:tetratricopeptide repeat protein [Candidatus Thiothrix anitrata]|uniref:Sel1 repeat family protein n=1 Tax=Candidatus Thiothrix anitrata TaxID=2823902 RepID=A0ABX7X8Q4_9GAMM|nr:tetratricopeptide repeat protein [Candidatus Thiothrix anitrata]QTR51608.1 sel1 repeat family protein [Candidatus Thiothrix anitrata]
MKRFLASLFPMVCLCGSNGWAESPAPHPKTAASFAMMAGEYERAAILLEPLATKGDPEAQYKLGLLGVEGAITTNAAILWMQKSADQGYSDAQFSLALSYLQGDGVGKDAPTGYKWLKKAAISNNPLAQYLLGRDLYEGSGIKQNIQEGISWLVKAAKTGETQSKEYLEKHDLRCPRDEKEAKLFGEPLVCSTRSSMKKAAQKNGYELTKTENVEATHPIMKGVFEDCYTKQNKATGRHDLCLRFSDNGLTLWIVSYNGLAKNEFNNLKEMLESEHGDGVYLPDLQQWQWRVDSRTTANIGNDAKNDSYLSLFLVDHISGKKFVDKSMSDSMKTAYQSKYSK